MLQLFQIVQLLYILQPPTPPGALLGPRGPGLVRGRAPGPGQTEARGGRGRAGGCGHALLLLGGAGGAV